MTIVPPPRPPLSHQPAHLNLRGLVFNCIKKIALAALSFFCCGFIFLGRSLL